MKTKGKTEQESVKSKTPVWPQGFFVPLNTASLFSEHAIAPSLAES